VAAAARVAAAGGSFRMLVGAGVAAKVLVVFCDGLASVDNAQARLTGTFHLGNGSHGNFSLRLGELNWC
jgi:hypothetical protein